MNRLFQTFATRSLVLTESAFEVKVAQCHRHLENYRRATRSASVPTRALELGTGWYPVVPVGLVLAGVGRVVTLDANPLLSPERVRRVLALYCSCARTDRLRRLLEVNPDAIDAIEELLRAHWPADAALDRLGIETVVRDGRSTGLPASSFELSISNNTLEHVRPDALAAISLELRRIATRSGVTSHFVDMSDHYAHFDHSITEFNFLRFSELAWRPFNNRLQYQNRLRLPDYERLLEEAGFRLVDVDSERGRGAELDLIRLARRFRRYSRADLLALRSWVTAVPA